MTGSVAWCLSCARESDVVGSSLVDGYPLVNCRWSTVDGKLHGHGRTLGTYDEAEADRLEADRHARRVAANHEAGRHRETIVVDCPACQAEAPHRKHVKARRLDPDCAECRAAEARTAMAAHRVG